MGLLSRDALADPVERRTMRSVRPRVVVSALALAGSVWAAGYLWLHRTHVIVYRAFSPGCESEVRYDTQEGPSLPTRFRERWESAPIALVHGACASIHVRPGTECRDVVRCELIEDRRSVATAQSFAGATCVACTGR
jgi:hypothetical protein